MSLPCKIEGELKLGANQRNETFIWYSTENRWLSMDEFAKCEIGHDAKIILKIQNEKIKSQYVLSNSTPAAPYAFNDYLDYGLSPHKLVLNDFGITTYEQQTQPTTTPTPPHNPTSVLDMFAGFAASMALVMAVAQQVRQKKQEVESNLCCNNNKIEINKFDVKLQKLETELKAQSQKDNKGMIAEILETRKELKEIKEEFESGKQDIEKIVEIMEIQRKNKT
jgi:hypothetical protein